MKKMQYDESIIHLLHGVMSGAVEPEIAIAFMIESTKINNEHEKIISTLKWSIDVYKKRKMDMGEDVNPTVVSTFEKVILSVTKQLEGEK